MPGARDGEGRDRFSAPFFMVAVFDQQGQRRAGGLAVHHAAQDADRVTLDLHARPGAKPLLPARQIAVNRGCRKRQPGRHPSRMAVSAGPCDSPAVRNLSPCPALPSPACIASATRSVDLVSDRRTKPSPCCPNTVPGVRLIAPARAAAAKPAESQPCGTGHHTYSEALGAAACQPSCAAPAAPGHAAPGRRRCAAAARPGLRS